MPLRVVVDPNVYISLLIGGSIVKLSDHLLSDKVVLILSEELIAEIDEQTSRTKFAKYFTREQADGMVQLLREAGTLLSDPPQPPAICRDPDDDYLLALSNVGKADILLTGDADLLVLGKHGRTRIMNAHAFAKEFLGGK